IFTPGKASPFLSDTVPDISLFCRSFLSCGTLLVTLLILAFSFTRMFFPFIVYVSGNPCNNWSNTFVKGTFFTLTSTLTVSFTVLEDHEKLYPVCLLISSNTFLSEVFFTFRLTCCAKLDALTWRRPIRRNIVVSFIIRPIFLARPFDRYHGLVWFINIILL